jgi:hypothetical protein
VDLGFQVGLLRQLQEELLGALRLALPGEVEEDAVVLVEEGVTALLVEEEVLEVAAEFFFFMIWALGLRKRERTRERGSAMKGKTKKSRNISELTSCRSRPRAP